jgi:hypothetical protein
MFGWVGLGEWVVIGREEWLLKFLAWELTTLSSLDA